jgi:hypothetical protein
MHRRIRGLPHLGLMIVVIALAAGLAACGSSSGSGGESASTLLKQTFTGTHHVNSGNLSLNLTVDPSGSSTLTGPISLSFGGPFQTRGPGKLPAENFTISVSALGKSGSIGLLSTGTAGYVTLQGVSYQLPAATFQKLASSFSRISSSGTSSGSTTLSSLGINPLEWLTSPTTVGSETVAGAQTTHIRANVNVAALLVDANKLLAKAASASGSTKIPTVISLATRQRIAREIKSPSVDVWTGTGDKTLRKLEINLSLPVSGKTSTTLGGMKRAAIGLTLQYANLNQPETVPAPTNVRPFTEFEAKVQAFVGALQSAFGGGTGTTASSGSTGSTGSAAKIKGYSKCIQQAGGDVTKMQKCASLLSG